MSFFKWFFLQALISIVFISIACSQMIDRKYILNWVEKSDPTFKTNNINLYVLNGVPFQPGDSTEFEDALKIQSKFLSIDYFKSDEFPFTEVIGKYVIVVSDNYLARKKSKKLELKIALSKYKKNDLQSTDARAKQPVLLINDKEIQAVECYDRITKIKLKQIMAISVINHAVPTEYYGENAKNGLVQIWTYEKK